MENNNFLKGLKFGEKLKKDLRCILNQGRLDDKKGVLRIRKFTKDEEKDYYFNIFETCYEHEKNIKTYKIVDKITENTVFKGNKKDYEYFCVGVSQAIEI